MRLVELTSQLPIIPVQPNESRADWYRLSNREKQRTPIDKALVGQVAYCQRLIVRTGYKYEPRDYPATVGQIEQAVLTQINQHRAALKLPKMSECELLDIIYITHKDNVARYFQPLRHQLAWEWTMRMAHIDRSSLNVRTFWYKDTPDFTYPYKIDIDRIVWRWCGARDPGYSGNSWMGDEYEPPSFENWVFQPLYEVGLLHMPFDHPIYDQHTYWVHPLDLRSKGG